jgi:hypothetical protein
MVPAYTKLDFETIFQAQVADDAFVIGFHLPKDRPPFGNLEAGEHCE